MFNDSIGATAAGDTSPGTRLIKRTTAEGDGQGETARSVPRGFLVPTDSGDGVAVLEPTTITTDHDTISVEARLSTGLVESELSRLREAGDVVREPTAYGAFRRIIRDAGAAVTLDPPEGLSPPFIARDVAVVGFDVESLPGDVAQVSVEFGLLEPRAREPIAGGGDTETLASETVSVGGGATTTTTLSGTAPTEFGDYALDVTSPDDTDSVIVSVSDAAIALSFPTGTLALAESQLEQPPRTADAGRRRVTLPVRLSSDGARVLFAVGSRVEAVAPRELPDAPTETRDTLPGGELSCALDAPDRLELDGDYVLAGWSLERETRGADRPYSADLELLEQRE